MLEKTTPQMEFTHTLTHEKHSTLSDFPCDFDILGRQTNVEYFTELSLLAVILMKMPSHTLTSASSLTLHMFFKLNAFSLET